MRTHYTLKAAALAGVCMLPLIAVANAQDADGFDVSTAAPKAVSNNLQAPDNEVTLGVGGVTTKNAVFGRYNGLTNSGVGGWGDFNLNARDAWDSGKTHYFSFTGDNLYFGNAANNPSIGGVGAIAPEASLNMKVGDQGKWGVNAFYNAMTYTWSTNFTTILYQAGNLNPGLQAAFIRNGAYLTNATSLGSFYNPPNARGMISTTAANTGPALGSANEYIDTVGTRRDLFGVSGNYRLGDWLFTSTVSDEHKEGSLENAMTTSGSNAGFIPFAMPIDYDTESYKVAGAYTTPRLQAQVGYTYSNFIDHNTGGYQFEGWNFAVANTGGVYNSFQESGVYSLPPSNQAHTFAGQVGYNLTPTTRFNATASYQLQLQNDPFAAATQNGFVLGSSTLSSQLASNPSNLSGVVQTFFGNATVNSHPLPKLNLKASYSIDMRTPEMSPVWIYGDATDSNALRLREAVQEQWTKQDMVLEAGYHVLDSTRVTLGYAYRDADRENAITHHTGDNEGSIRVNSTLTPNLIGILGYVHAERTASAPDFSLWNLQINSDCGSSLTAGNNLGCQQVPFYEAARTEDAVTAMLNGTIRPDMSASLYGKFTNNQYHNDDALYHAIFNSPVGIDHDYSVQAGPNLSYRYAQGSEAHIFYTYLRNYRDMRALANTAGEYNEASTYDIHTAGIGGTWKVAEKTKVGADYIYSYGNQAFNQSGIWTMGEAGQNYGGDPQLNTQSSNNQFKVHATYDLTTATQLYLAYEFDSLDMADWALTGASVGQVLTGDLPAHYNVSTVMAAVKMKW